MKISFFRSLRYKMPLLVLTGIVPLILIAIFYASDRGTKTIRSEAEENLVLRGKVLTQDINRWNKMNVLALTSLSKQESIKSMDASRQKPALVEIVDTYEHFYRATTIKLDGWTLARNDNRESQYRGDRDYFKKSVAGDSNIAYQTLISRSIKKPALCMSKPIRQQLLFVVGVAMVCSDLEAITEQIGQMRFGNTGYAFLVDNEGKVLAHPNAKFISGDKLTNLNYYPPVANFLQGNLGKQFFQDEKGIDWVYYSSRLDNNWGVIIVQEKSEFLKGEQEFQNLAFIIASVSVISASVLTFLLANYLIGPITKLTNSAIALSNGKWDRRVEINRKDELGILAKSFDRMAIKLKDLFQSLEQRIEQRTSQLKKSKEAAEKAKENAIAANQAKDRFIANMSHELITPLNSILGYTKIVQKDDLLTKESANNLKIVEHNSIHLLTLINQLLAFSEMKLNKIELYPSDLQLSSFLDEIVDRMSLSARSKQLQIIRKWEDLPDRVKIDEKRLRQILINLLSNAIKFTNTGEINIKVKALEIMKTNESLYQQKLRFEVRDTGIGMSERDKKKIFQPFEQLRDIQSRIAGTGLGLSIAERLIKLMGGNLKVESELGVGSTFWFELLLPVVANNKPSEEITGEIIGYQGSERKILIVDDRLENRNLLIKILEPIGFNVATANNGEEMLNIADSFEPDLILLDLFMPVKTGFSSAKEIRQIPKLRNIPIIIITASAINKEMVNYINCQEILDKPVNERELLLNVQKYLNLQWIYRDKKGDNVISLFLK